MQRGAVKVAEQEVALHRSTAGVEPRRQVHVETEPRAGGSQLARMVGLRRRALDDAVVAFAHGVPEDVLELPGLVAAERHAVAALPLEIVLDDGDSPMPTQVLSQLEDVIVSARIPASGTVERSAGDLESPPVRVSLPTASIVELVIGAE